MYDEKAAAEANQEKKLDQLEGDPKHVAVEEEKGVGAEPVQRGGRRLTLHFDLSSSQPTGGNLHSQSVFA